jgi:hypothetical protein
VTCGFFGSLFLDVRFVFRLAFGLPFVCAIRLPP